MIGTLLRLFAMERRAWFRHQLRSLRSPRRLIALALMIVLVGLRFVALHRAAPPLGDQRTALTVLGAMLFILSLSNGFLQQGPRFTPADIDFLFPAPVSPRGLLFFRLLHLWPLALVSSAFIVLFTVGADLRTTLRLLVGLFLLQITAIHLQLLISVLTTRLGDAAAKRLRGAARVFALLALFGGVFVLIFAITQQGGIAEAVRPFATAPVARMVLFPAAACADFVYASGTTSLLFALARLLAGVVGSGLLLMVPEIDFREESIVTTGRISRLLAQRQRGETMIDLEQARRVRSRTVRAAALFAGSGAVVWKNVLIFTRSLRSVVPGLIFSFLFVIPALFATKTQSYSLLIPSSSAILMVTLFASNSFNFDLRREIDRIDVLRALPIAPAAIVLAELLVPWALSVLLQEALIGVIASFLPAERMSLGHLSLALPIASFVMIVIDNLAVFLLAPKPGAGGGRNFGTSSPAQLLRMLAWVVALAPAAGAYALARHLEWSLAACTVALLGTMAAVAAALFFLLVRCFERREFATGE